MRAFLSAAIAVGLALPAPLVLATPASAAKFWRCANGYNLEGPNNGAVRCVRPEVTTTAALAPCPPGSAPVANAPPARDQCRIAINNTRTDRICQLPTDRYNSIPGPDSCRRVTTPGDSRPPDVEVQR